MEIPTVQTDIAYVKKGLETLSAKRKFFLENILPTLIEGQDFFVIEGKRSISKGGAERLAEIYNLTATFTKDNETLASFGNASGLIAYICQLKREGQLVAEGRGSANIEDYENSANSSIKCAMVSSFKDAVLRATGTSFMFTQDIENMNLSKEIDYEGRDKQAFYGDEDMPKLMTEKQEALLRQLIAEKIHNPSSRQEYERQINPLLSRFQCSELISSLLPMK
ncbi:hypothetical protein EXS45_02355 [Candidatus Nomurabacteria bacterium]|nr:hypothetical protein [Candidatus Nomurabacteria bacterium]